MAHSFELFSEDGHLTEAGLRALAGEGLTDEMQRLEAAEHLGFCDACLLEYTRLLTDEVLLVPEAPLEPGVMRKLRRKKLRQSVARYATVAAAACLAVAMWTAGTGLLSVRTAEDDRAGAQAANQTAAAQADATPEPGIGFKLSRGLSSISESLGGFFSNLMPGGAKHGADEDEDQADTTPRRRESLFGRGDDKADDVPDEPDSGSMAA